MTKYRLSDRASRHLDEIYAHTSQKFGRSQAKIYIAGFSSAFALLAQNPRMGRSADHIRLGLRRHEHEGHVILYRELREGLLILAVVHARRRLELAMEEP